MRPRHYTAEYVRQQWDFVSGAWTASMRPRHYTAEYLRHADTVTDLKQPLQ
jgi:hypothetical protein